MRRSDARRWNPNVPDRGTGPTIFAGGGALQQPWMFWVASLVGGALGGGIYRMLFEG